MIFFLSLLFYLFVYLFIIMPVLLGYFPYVFRTPHLPLGPLRSYTFHSNFLFCMSFKPRLYVDVKATSSTTSFKTWFLRGRSTLSFIHSTSSHIVIYPFDVVLRCPSSIPCRPTLSFTDLVSSSAVIHPSDDVFRCPSSLVYISSY